MSPESDIKEPALKASADLPVPIPPEARAGVGLIAVVVIAILASGLSVGTYHLIMAPRLTRIAVVDLPAVYRDKESAFEKAITKENATQAERDAALNIAAEFARQLPKALDELATECSCTVLAANAVAGHYNALDLTPSLRAKIGL